MTGRLIAVVGPSGVGKDSLMAELVAAMPTLQLVRRTITRPAGQSGEDYDALLPHAFAAEAAAGAFALHWEAHGLTYGIPVDALRDVHAGKDCLANLSRGALARAAEAFPALIVLNITAHPDVLAARLKARGRETTEGITNRLSQAEKPLPDGLDVITLSNDGPLDATVRAAIAALQPEKV